METLFEVDRQIAEDIWGWQPGRPTISRRVGGRIGRAIGVTTETGTDLFHGVLLIAFVAFIAALMALLVRVFK